MKLSRTQFENTSKLVNKDNVDPLIAMADVDMEDLKKEKREELRARGSKRDNLL